jgi:hypothetical protein
MVRSREAANLAGRVAVLWAVVLAGVLVGVGAGVGGNDVEFAADASSVARRMQRQVERRTKVEGRTASILIAAGDIADCGTRADSATAALVRDIPGTIATLGDHAYESGTKQDFADCYDPTWGAERNRTRPAPGNHEYETRGAKGYFDYFGGAAGDRGKGYYSYDLGAWHIIVLNSDCDEIGGCGTDSPQGRWLRRDLAAHPATCILAYWHHPLFSSGREHGGDEAMKPAWEALYDARAEVVLSAHEHNYERFAPQDPDGKHDRKRGIRQFVVGTGGASHYGFGRPLTTSEVRESGTFGVLVLTLHSTGYHWVFVPVESRFDLRGPFTDSGSRDCH